MTDRDRETLEILHTEEGITMVREDPHHAARPATAAELHLLERLEAAEETITLMEQREKQHGEDMADTTRENERLREEQADLYKFLSIHEARIEAALALHVASDGMCRCGGPWPCPTEAVLKGEEGGEASLMASKFKADGITGEGE